MDNTEEFTAIELCAGYGGIHLGLKRVIPNLRTVAYSEIELFAIQNLVSKMEKGYLEPAPIWSNLKTFPAAEFRERVHIITGGYPCQPFSQAGQRKGADDPRHLWPHISRIVSTVRPLYCFFENVEGHVTLGLNTVISDLGELGYRTTWGIFSAAECGASHQRKRVFILGRLANTESERAGREPFTVCKENGRQGGSLSRKPNESSQKLVHTGYLGSSKCKMQTAGIEQSGEGREELGDTEHTGSHGSAKPGGVATPIRNHTERTVTTGEPEGASNTGELANSNECGRKQDRKSGELRTGSIIESSCDCRRADQTEGDQGREVGPWPARPGEEQHEWEPPRVMDDTGNGRFIDGGKNDRTDNGDGDEVRTPSTVGKQSRETQSQVGGNPDGYPDWMVSADSRIDELRLLGNGVVPATVEKAWRILSARIELMTERM